MSFISTNRLITIDHHISAEEDLHPEATGDFSSLLHDLTFAIRMISRDVRRGGLSDILGLTSQQNVHGEQVRKLDKYSNEVIKKAVLQGGHVCVLASEEEKELIVPDKPSKHAKYVLVYDPLDGSSNIDVNITIGSIFSIYRRLDDSLSTAGSVEDILQCGYKQVAAGYALYGSSTILVYTTGHGVYVFTYDPTLGEFLLTNENLRIPTRGNIYSCNEGNYFRWNANMRKYVDYLKMPSEDGARPYLLRYIASGVADIHRTLHYGGIYMYPEDEIYPNGKFRIVYEANALAMIVEQAGGRASDGKIRIQEKKPKSIHERTPLIIGSRDDVLECELFLEGNHPFQLRQF